MAHPAMTPRATYRLQLHAGFTFADAERIVPYLRDLGISHVYASPITVATKGSLHGYDVIDPTRINPELGGEAGLRSLVAALRAHDMGLIIDIVPNHMGVAGDENLWWMAVLERGQASRYAPVFDIDWREPVVLPVLGAPVPDAIAAGDIRLVERGDGLGIQVHGGPVYPVRPDDPALEEDRATALARHRPEADGRSAALNALLDRQHYRLIYWRGANDRLNWRRFFSINELAGVRVEDPDVFALTHRLFFDLFAQGLIEGVRVDHVDGLADPATYCRTLRAGFEAVTRDRQAYIVVEKILATDEPLATDWGVDGTSGYDFMRDVSGLLHDPAGTEPLRTLWGEISGRSPDFDTEAREARRDLLSWQFEGQLGACVESFLTLARAEGRDWLTAGMLRRAMQALLWTLPVYRTYGSGTEAPPGDARVRETARQAAIALAAPGEVGVIDFILARLAGGNNAPETPSGLASEAVRRFQQLSAPIAAKGVEDTAFYRHAALLSANDVGFDPAQPALTAEQFHAATLARAAAHPHAMLATATHDHKRGEDARARLAVLSTIAEEWEAAVRRWMALAAPHGEGIDPGDIYQLFQALAGAWDGWNDDLLARIHDWQDKMLREAKLRSSWEAPDEDYEARYHALAKTLLDADTGASFRSDFQSFLDALAPAALANSLTQTLLHYTLPGVPDLYQGCELMDYSMVDPDNRRPVEYAQRSAKLNAADSASPKDAGAAKLALISKLLALRHENSALFAEGSYVPLPVTGPRAEHIIAFTRSHGGQTLLCAATIRIGKILLGRDGMVMDADWWHDTQVDVHGQSLMARDLLAEPPILARIMPVAG